ncbi:hypothetical protein PMAL9190_01652 [Photobacterium malacitanum]|uniref:Uncharacterized protein n=1 Tax=Photobacterium malacitanum TaxID=2204294 RepID=A0A1Y6MCW3_9GAMM|nr:hypothetical protein PMAL9190_01652 [Photobacterium malacitanum]
MYQLFVNRITTQQMLDVNYSQSQSNSRYMINASDTFTVIARTLNSP